MRLAITQVKHTKLCLLCGYGLCEYKVTGEPKFSRLIFVVTKRIGLEPLTMTFCAKRQKSLFGFLRSFSSEKDLKPRGSDWSAERDDSRRSRATPRERLLLLERSDYKALLQISARTQLLQRGERAGQTSLPCHTRRWQRFKPSCGGIMARSCFSI